MTICGFLCDPHVTENVNYHCRFFQNSDARPRGGERGKTEERGDRAEREERGERVLHVQATTSTTSVVKRTRTTTA